MLDQAAALLRGAERPLIVAGGGAIYAEATERAARASAEQTGIPVAETQAGKGSLPYDHPQSLGAIGATGTHGRQRAGARGRPGDRRRHALERLHDRLAHAVRRPRRALRQPQRRAGSTPSSTSGLALVGGRAGSALEALRDRAGAGRRRLPRAATAPRRRVGREVERTYTLGHAPAARAGRGASARSTECSEAARRRRLRGRLDARRPAQALAHARPEGLPPRVRLLVHGLRDRRRARREDGRAGPRGVRAWSATART